MPEVFYDRLGRLSPTSALVRSRPVIFQFMFSLSADLLQEDVMPSFSSTPPEHISILEEAYESFEAAWQNQPFPSIRRFVAGVPDQLLLEALRGLVHIDLERRWRTDTELLESDRISTKPRVEDYAKELPELGPAESLPIELIEAECIARHRWGDGPAPSEFVERFPARAVEVRSLCEQAIDGLIDQKRTDGKNERSSVDEETVITGDDPALTHGQQNDLRDAIEQSFQTLDAGVRIDHYILREKLGEGGFGVVFRAQDVNRPYQECAIKLIRPDRAADGKVLSRFQQEIAALTGLSHPNIVCAAASGEWEGIQFLVMEYVNGVSVSRLLSQKRRLAVADASELVRQAALGLQHIHENQRAHRDSFTMPRP